MKYKNRDEQIEHNLAQVNASLSMEGMAFSEDEKAYLRQFAKGELSMDDLKKIALNRVNQKK